MQIINVEQLSEAWFFARLGRVTGTRFKDMMAGKTTASYNNLISEIASEIITNSSADEPSYENEWMLRGQELEPEAREHYAQLMEVNVIQAGFITPDEPHKFHEWVGISPDGLIVEYPIPQTDFMVYKGMIEIKCPKRTTHIFYIRNDKLPDDYYWQVHGELYVTGLPYCDFVSYYPKMKPFIVRVFPDPEIFKLIDVELKELISRVKKLISIYNDYEPI